MGLFKPAWQSDNQEKALRAVEKETDQIKLAVIANNAPLDNVRVAAVNKLTNQTVLAEMAKHEKNEWIYVAAVKILTDQATLAYVAKNRNSSYERKVAVQKLSNQRILAEIAQNDNDYDVQKTAFGNITNQYFLEEIARNTGCFLRNSAVEQLKNQEILIDIARNDKNDDIRIDAAIRLTDKSIAQSVYADIVNNGKDVYCRAGAIQALTDKEMLMEIASSDSKEKYSVEMNVIVDFDESMGDKYATRNVDLREKAHNRIMQLNELEHIQKNNR